MPHPTLTTLTNHLFALQAELRAAGSHSNPVEAHFTRISDAIKELDRTLAELASPATPPQSAA
jgi:hypothetical protein